MEIRIIPDARIGTYEDPKYYYLDGYYIVHPLLMPFPEQKLQEWIDSLRPEQEYHPED